jgi:hypothetical protein
MPETITLGGRQFALRPLTLGQLRPVLDALADMSGKSGGALIDAAVRVVAAGLAPVQPEITPDAVLDLAATVDDLNEAVAAVLGVAGLKPLGEAPSPDGRPPVAAVPGMASPASNSPTSTPPSPPAAVTPTP